MKREIDISWRTSKLVRTRKQKEQLSSIPTTESQPQSFNLKAESIKARLYLKLSSQPINREGKNKLIENYTNRVSNLLGAVVRVNVS